MDLRRRLAELEPLLGPRPAAAASTGAAAREAALAALGLTRREGPAGPVWTREETWPAPAPDLAAVQPPLLTRPLPPGTAAGDLLLLDTETSGLAGGTGTLPFLVGTAWWEGETLRARQYLLPGPGGEAALLAALARLATRFRVAVTFNGACFDLPLLRARATLHRRRTLLEHLLGWDLLPTARRLWGRRTPDCRQGSVERAVGCPPRHGDLPGHLVPGVWQAFLRTGRPGRLGAVLEHNVRDLAGMARIVAAAAERGRLFRRPDAGDRLPWQDGWALARLAERAGDPALADAWISRALAGCRRPPEALWRDAVRLLKRTRPPRELAALLERILRRYPDARWVHRELAVVWEHRLRDHRRALEHARRLGDAHRAGRLCRKLEAAGVTPPPISPGSGP